MSQGIHITSLAALRDFQTSLVQYGHEVDETLVSAESDASQALSAVEDALLTELRHAEACREDAADASANLRSCLEDSGDEDEDEPDCSAEESALEVAEEAVREAEARVEALQHARNRLEEAFEPFRSKAQCLKNFLELDLSHADATLGAKVDAIEVYLAVASPGKTINPVGVHSSETTPVLSSRIVGGPERIGPLFQDPSQMVTKRIAELYAAIPPAAKRRMTMAVAIVENRLGFRFLLVATSEKRGYLRPGVSLNEGETIVAGTGHAEADIITHARVNDLRVIDIGATRPVCEICQEAINPTGSNISTPLRPRLNDGKGGKSS